MELKKDTIYTFKMNSGEEMVAKVVGIESTKLDAFPVNTSIVISNPVSIGPGPGGGLGLVPSLFTYNPEGEVRLNTNSIAVIAETDESIISKYIQATTGIKMPDKKIILG